MCRKGFTLWELLVGVLVMSIITAVSMLSPLAANQSVKREAERVAMKIYSVVGKSERIQKNFYLEVFSGFIRFNWHDMTTIDDSFKSSAGLSYSDNFTNGKANYNSSRRRFTNGGTITVKDKNDGRYYVILAGITEGRIRISDTPPK